MNDKWLGAPPAIIIPRLKSLLADLEQLASPSGRPPPTDVVLIRNCMLVSRAVPCLMGEVVGHPELEDGKPTVSSELFYIDKKRRLGRTLSRWYHFDEGLL